MNAMRKGRRRGMYGGPWGGCVGYNHAEVTMWQSEIIGETVADKLQR
jgi:hypothetical protein